MCSSCVVKFVHHDIDPDRELTQVVSHLISSAIASLEQVARREVDSFSRVESAASSSAAVDPDQVTAP